MNENRSGFWTLVWEGIVSANGVSGGILAIIAGIVTWQLTAALTAPVWVVVALVLVLVLFVLIFVQALRIAVRRIRAPSTQVLAVRKPSGPYARAKGVFVVRFSELVPVSAVVTFYRSDNEYDEPIGSGTVRHVQPNEGAHVTLDRVYETSEINAFVKKLVTEGNKEAITSLRVSPMVMNEHMAGIITAETKEEEEQEADASDDPGHEPPANPKGSP